MLDCVAGEDSFVTHGIGGAGDLIDLGLEANGFGLDGSPEAWGLRGPEQGCVWTVGSAGRLLRAGSFPGMSLWSTEQLLSAKIVNS